MGLALLAVLLGLVLLIWSADRFIEGAANTAKHFGMSPLLIGMVIVGFGTSAPEIAVSVLAAIQGNPGIALGNAFGSNISNIALILGITALISPITVRSQILRRELPILIAVTGLAILLLWDLTASRLDAVILLVVFAVLMLWTILQDRKTKADVLATEVNEELKAHSKALGPSILWLIIGLVLLIISSRLLVWGAVELARGLGVNDLIIGLTIVAIGTSLPELASSIIATRKGEHDIALGNVIGSNLFNTLAVVGLAAVIHPMEVAADVLSRDVSMMSLLTISLYFMSYGFKGPGRIHRYEAAALLLAYIAYTSYLVSSLF